MTHHDHGEEGNGEAGERSPRGQSMSALAKVVGVFLGPQKTFDAVDERPDWAVPMAIIVAVSLVLSYLMMPAIMNSPQLQEQIESAAERGNMTYEDAEEMIGKTIRVFVPVQAAIGPPIAILIVAGLLMFVGNVVMGGKAPFKKVYSMNTYSGLIGVLGQVVKAPIVMAKESLDVQFSLALVMPSSAQDSTLFKLLDVFDFFLIWQSVILVTGIMVIYKFTQKKAATMIVGLWAAGLAVYGVILSVT